jgi:hypothetical protein
MPQWPLEQKSPQQVPPRREQFPQQWLTAMPETPPPTMRACSRYPGTGAAEAKIGGNERTLREPEVLR